MLIRRIFAGSIVALLFCVSALAAGCDLSCAFASMNSDCHSHPSESQISSSHTMSMDGNMDMAGMTMPEAAQGGDHPTVSTMSEAKAGHASIGEMGACEKQPCNGGSAVSAKTQSNRDSYFHSNAAIAGISPAGNSPVLFRNPRDRTVSAQLGEESSLRQNLRI
jgi:hypothetical protein